MARAWTGVGVVKPALPRRFFKESEILKSLKWTFATPGRPVAVVFTAGILEGMLEGMCVSVCCGSRVAVVKRFPFGCICCGIGMQGCQGTMDF